MKQLIITGPKTILDAIENLVNGIWDADHRYEALNMLNAEIVDVEEGEGK
jgi:hypothetical protein